MVQDLTQEAPEFDPIRFSKKSIGLVFFDNLTRIHKDNAVSNFFSKAHLVRYTQHRPCLLLLVRPLHRAPRVPSQGRVLM